MGKVVGNGLLSSRARKEDAGAPHSLLGGHRAHYTVKTVPKA